MPIAISIKKASRNSRLLRAYTASVAAKNLEEIILLCAVISKV
jgi:hypothetical protein